MPVKTIEGYPADAGNSGRPQALQFLPAGRGAESAGHAASAVNTAHNKVQNASTEAISTRSSGEWAPPDDKDQTTPSSSKGYFAPMIPHSNPA